MMRWYDACANRIKGDVCFKGASGDCLYSAECYKGFRALEKAKYMENPKWGFPRPEKQTKPRGKSIDRKL